MVTVIIRYTVNPDNMAQYEKWGSEMERISATYPGFLSRDILPPIAEEQYHITVLRFDTADNAKSWMRSEQRTELIKVASVYFLNDIREVVHHGVDFWFNLNNNSLAPPKWKQWLITFAVVLPLGLAIPWMMNKTILLIIPSNWIINSLFSSLLISYLMVFFIMPFVLRKTNKWLHKT